MLRSLADPIMKIGIVTIEFKNCRTGSALRPQTNHLWWGNRPGFANACL